MKKRTNSVKKAKRLRKISIFQETVQPKRYIPLVLILIAIVLIAFAVTEIFKKDVINSKQVNNEREYVLGLDKIPVYTNSYFLFTDSLDDPSVKEMLSTGKSVYKITDRATFENIKEFYANELNALGWDLVLDVPIGTEEKKYGQYWTKDEKGLRIYTKHNDIWYEYITPQEAESGLSNRVSEEIEIGMLLAGSDYQELLPDYPWQIKIPKDYLIRYEVSEFKDLRAVSFQRISTSQIITLYPVGFWGAKSMDAFVDEYVDILSEKTPNEQTWGIKNTVVSSFQGGTALSGAITNSLEERSIMVIKNSKNSVAYILSAQDQTDPLVEYLLKNLRFLGQEES